MPRTRATDAPAVPDVSAEVAARLEQHQREVAGRLFTRLMQEGNGRSGSRRLLSALGLTMPDPTMHTVTVTFQNVPGASVEHVRTEVERNALTLTTDGGERYHRATNVEVTSDTPVGATSAIPRTVAGEQATAAAIQEWDTTFYQRIVNEYSSLADDPASIGVTLPPTQEFRVMVPMTISAFSADAARTIARNAVRSSYRAPAFGQQDYVPRPEMDAVIIEGSENGSQPARPADE